MRKVTLSAIQPPDHRAGATLEERKADNVRIVFSLMEEAAQAGVDLICLPETFPVVGLVENAEMARHLADEENGELAHCLCAFARKHRINLVAPVLAQYDGVLRNVAWVMSREGDRVGHYFKVHCTRQELQRGIVPGETWPVFDLDFGRLGVMICHDNTWPESARCLRLNGAEVICWPHIQSGWGDVQWDITLRSRAIDNAVYLVSACYGVPTGKAWRPGMMIGHSGVVGPEGTVLADGERLPGVVLRTVDLDQAVLKAGFSPRDDNNPETDMEDDDFRAVIVDERRPTTYAPLTRIDT